MKYFSVTLRKKKINICEGQESRGEDKKQDTRMLFQHTAATLIMTTASRVVAGKKMTRPVNDIRRTSSYASQYSVPL